MNRRTVIRNFALTGLAALVLPGCLSDKKKKVTDSLGNLDITEEDEQLLGELAATLIPATDKPGAKEVGAHLFTFVMIEDCHPAEEKQQFIEGLRAFNESAPVPSGKSFMDASGDERLEALKALEGEKGKANEALAKFYGMARRHIIDGYTTSEYFLTNVKKYQLVPGPVYKGCVPLSETI